MQQNINNFLENFKNKLFKEEGFKDFIIETIKEKTNISLKKDQIVFVNNIIKTSVDSYLKTEIFLNKENILNKIKEKYPEKKIIDIF